MTCSSIRWLLIVAGAGTATGGISFAAGADETVYTNDFNGPRGIDIRRVVLVAHLA